MLVPLYHLIPAPRTQTPTAMRNPRPRFKDEETETQKAQRLAEGTRLAGGRASAASKYV